MTSTGKLLTWGSFSSGALGLGDPTQLPAGSAGGYVQDSQRERAKRYRIVPPDVNEPTEVKFGTSNGSDERETFVFGATAAGWHTGALVIDLDVRWPCVFFFFFLISKILFVQDREEPVEREELRDDDDDSHQSLPGPPWFGHVPFRIGLAGARGRGRGGST